MILKFLVPFLVALVALPAQAHDDRTRAAIGAGLGAAAGAYIGSELGGRNEAILGGAIGGAVGAGIATDDRHDDHRHYRTAPRYEHWDDRRYHYRERGHRHERMRRGPSFCPPGLGRQGRC